MADGVNAEIRLLVAGRADHLCEYCLIAENDTFFGCQVDHIISLKHHGQTKAENLAYACAFCNRFKGSDIASLSSQTGALVRLFNPR
jgi:5-methylcytosine-specific restriction endonuclease McrA